MSKLSKINRYVDHIGNQIIFTTMVGFFTRIAFKAGKQVVQDINRTPFTLRPPR